jgi:hypothetical protein
MSSCTAATIWPPLAVVQPTFSAAEQGCRAVAGDDVADEHGGVQAVGIDGQRIVLVHSQGVALQIRSQPGRVRWSDRDVRGPEVLEEFTRSALRCSSGSWMTSSRTPSSSRATAMGPAGSDGVTAVGAALRGCPDHCEHGRQLAGLATCPSSVAGRHGWPGTGRPRRPSISIRRPPGPWGRPDLPVDGEPPRDGGAGGPVCGSSVIRPTIGCSSSPSLHRARRRRRRL